MFRKGENPEIREPDYKSFADRDFHISRPARFPVYYTMFLHAEAS